MKTLPNPPRLRPVSSHGRVARTRKEAAVQLVRIEFDISRLETAIAQAEKRAEAHSAELAVKTRQRDALLQVLQD